MHFPSIIRPLGLLALLLATSPAFANNPAGAKMRSSDCRPRDADSTCATAVAGATMTPPEAHPDSVLYDGPLGGVPAMGYAYWGFDFVADEAGTPSPVRDDEFINRSNVPVTITFTFDIPARCKIDCIPSVQFQADAGWHKIYPPLMFDGHRLTSSATFLPGRGYGWIVALLQAGNPRLTVTVPGGSNATLRTVGLPALPAIASEIPPFLYRCACSDGTTAPCTKGTRFSNGLLGPWNDGDDMYQRAGAYDCFVDH